MVGGAIVTTTVDVGVGVRSFVGFWVGVASVTTAVGVGPRLGVVVGAAVVATAVGVGSGVAVGVGTESGVAADPQAATNRPIPMMISMSCMLMYKPLPSYSAFPISDFKFHTRQGHLVGKLPNHRILLTKWNTLLR